MGNDNNGANTITAHKSSYVYNEVGQGYGTAGCAWTSGYTYEDPSNNKHPLYLAQSNVGNGTSYSGVTWGCGAFNHVPDIGGLLFGGDAHYKAFITPADPTQIVNWSINGQGPGAIFSFAAISDAHGDTVQMQPNTLIYGVSNPVTMEDSNGNFANTTGRSGSYYGFVPYPSLTGSGTSAPVTTNSSGVSASTIQFPGSSAPFIYQWTPVQSTFGTTAMDISIGTQANYEYLCGVTRRTYGKWFNTGNANQSDSSLEVQSITLPDGLQYLFAYDSVTGLLNQITYPTGAIVTYTWGDNTNSEVIGFNAGTQGTAYIYGVPNGLDEGVSPWSLLTNQCYFRHDFPAITQRVVMYDGKTPALVQTFTYSTTWPSNTSLDWTSKSTTIVTIDMLTQGNPSYKTVYNYAPDFTLNSSGFNYTSSKPTESTVVYYDTAGNIQRTVTKLWASGLDGVLSAECITIANGQTSGTFYRYTPWQGGLTGTSTLGGGIVADAPTDIAEYDYGQVSASCAQPAGTPAREQKMTYASFKNTPLWPAIYVNNMQVSNPYILDRPATVQVFDHGVLIRETDYNYDEYGAYPIVPVTPSAIGHDETNYGPNSSLSRGNPTTITKKCFTASHTCTNSVYHIQYDETGQPVYVYDANGNKSTLVYTDNYTADDGTVPGNTNTYLTQINLPTTNGVSHVEKFQWDYNKGELRVAWDENQNATYYYYNDPWNRLSEADYPDGGKTTVSYSDANPVSVTTTQLINSSPLRKVTMKLMDGVGHLTQTQLQSDPYGTVYVDQYFNGLGEIYQSSTPYRLGESYAWDNLITKYSYDSLGRKTAQTNPDSTTLMWCYDGVPSNGQTNCLNHIASNNGSWVDLTDENSNAWQKTINAFGQLTNVIEPNGVSKALTMETGYKYDMLNNLLSVTQWGGPVNSTGARTRIFSYDSFSRLLMSTNPETGNILYSYDANNNLTSKTDARGVLTIYKYDALNRVLSKSYSDGSTPWSCYQYDGPSSMNGVGRMLSSWTQKSSIGSCAASAPSLNYLTMRAIQLYDPMGRLKNESQVTPASFLGGTSYQPHYTYDLAGNLLTSTDGTTPSPTTPGATLTFTNCFDAAMRLQATTSNWFDSVHPLAVFTAQTTQAVPCPTPSPNNLSSTPYAAFGGLLNAMYGNGLTLSRNYDDRLRIVNEADRGSLVITPTAGSATVTINGVEQSK